VTPFRRLKRTTEDAVVGSWLLLTIASPLLGLALFTAGFASEVRRVRRRRARTGA
jgi:hypothetical protein